MHESGRMKDLIESVRKVLNDDPLTEARLPGYKILPMRWRRATLRTKGDGLFAQHDDAEKPTDVVVDKAEFMYTEWGGGYNYYIKVYIDPKTWNGRKMGTLCTDTGFEKALRKELQNQGYPSGPGISYADIDHQGPNHLGFAIEGTRLEKEWEKKMKVPRWVESVSEATRPFSARELEQLKASYSSIDRVDPESENYKKLTRMLDSLSKEHLQQLASSKIKFVSLLAANRVRRMKEDVVKGGLADGKTPKDIARKHGTSEEEVKAQIAKGAKVEKEHTDDAEMAREIATDHVFEDPKYYDKLARVESE